MAVIKFENVSKKYKLYSKGGLYLRDRVTHALQRMNPFNGAPHSSGPQSPVSPLERDFWALKNVSFEIKQGESVGFIGRNGAGKSTILKLLAGVTKPSSGKVDVNGKVAALIEVGAGFHPELTGRENIYLNGSILGMKKVELNKQFDSIVSFAELEDFIDTPVKHYSSGMYVRLGFAIAAHTNPDIYLIDEVLAVGDEAFQKKCLDTLAAHKAAGKTMILISHNLEKVAEICDRCIYVSHGEKMRDGFPAVAIRQYRSDVNRSLDRIIPSENGVVQAAEIVGVAFRKKQGEETIEFQTGDDLVVEIRYRAYRKIENPVFGIAIYGSNRAQVTGFNTRTNGSYVQFIENEGSIFCRIPRLSLNEGVYLVSVSLHDFEGAQVYDYHQLRYKFLVGSGREHIYGLVRFTSEWAWNSEFSRDLPSLDSGGHHHCPNG